MNPSGEFEQNRAVLTDLAYRMLGQLADAEDVVQEAWLRWSVIDHSTIGDPRAFLLRVVTRLAIDRARRARTRRENYIGPWLPEPLLTQPDVAEVSELGGSISIALLVVLETLSPLERAVFVLREAFGFTHSEIATITGRTEASVRQVAHRAREHVQERRPRFDADPHVCARVTDQFLKACQGGDIDRLLSVLAPDVMFVGDSGGIGRAPRHPIHGADKVARFLVALRNTPVPDVGVELVTVNRALAILVKSGDKPMAVFAFNICDGLIQNIYAIANPEKLEHVFSGGGDLTPEDGS